MFMGCCSMICCNIVQGLEFMLKRERQRDALDRGLLHLDPCWIQLITESGYVFYINRCGHA